MAVVLKTFAKGIRVEPNLADPASPTTGMIYYNSTDNRLKAYVAGASRVVTTNDLADTLTNKTIDAPANTITNLANTNIAADAAIAYSKLNLADSIVNADINTAAAIAYSKLNLADSIVNADINSAAAIAYSKLNLAASIVNADINASAAIERTKLASGTAHRILINNDSGVMSESAALTDGQLLIGSTGLAPVATTITGTANQVNVTNGAGSITLSTPQDIASGSSPTFAGLTVGTLTGPLKGSSGVVSAGNIDLTTEVTATLPVSNGGTGVTALSDVVGTADQVSISGGTARVIGGDVTLSLPQSIATTSEVNFKSVTSTDATKASFLLAKTGTNASNVEIANEGSVTGTSLINATAQPFKIVQGAASKLELDATGNLTLKENILSEKKWFGVSENDAALYVNDTASTPGTFIKRITNNGADNVYGITAPASGSQFFVLTNAKSNGEVFTLENQSASATAANRIITGNDLDLRLAGGASAWLYYDTSSSRWRVVGGSGGGGKVVTGSMGSPVQVGAADTIATTAGSDEEIYVESAAGEVTMTSNPQLAAGTVDGETKLIIGTSSTNYIVLVDGNGLKLNGDWQSLLDHTLTLRWNGTIWVDKGRSNI